MRILMRSAHPIFERKDDVYLLPYGMVEKTTGRSQENFGHFCSDNKICVVLSFYTRLFPEMPLIEKLKQVAPLEKVEKFLTL